MNVQTNVGLDRGCSRTWTCILGEDGRGRDQDSPPPERCTRWNCCSSLSECMSVGCWWALTCPWRRATLAVLGESDFSSAWGIRIRFVFLHIHMLRYQLLLYRYFCTPSQGFSSQFNNDRSQKRSTQDTQQTFSKKNEKQKTFPLATVPNDLQNEFLELRVPLPPAARHSPACA